MKIIKLAIVTLVAFALLAGPALAFHAPASFYWGIGGAGFGGLSGCNIGSLFWPLCAGGPFGACGSWGVPPWLLGGGITF